MVSIKSLTLAAMAFTTSVLGAENARITYYDNQNPSNMQFGSCEQPQGTLKAPFGAAMSPTDNGKKQACGKCINVHYGGKSVKVQVLDLWDGAFKVLAPLEVGVLTANWDWVAC